MPIYEYVCTVCGARHEVMHGIHAAPPSACPECGALLRKALSVPAIHFKGSGWAKMDARAGAHTSPSTPVEATGDSPAGQAAGSGGESKSPAEKATTPPATPSGKPRAVSEPTGGSDQAA